MCGIAGIWGDPSVERLRAMADSLRHRGPDDEGFWTQAEERIGFAHRRLSIIDLKGGHQPVFNEDRSIVTIFNGEIYNYRELREELIARGHRFATQSDTEVIVHLYEEMGPDAVTRMRGMFAIAIWDDNARQLVLYRDRVGKKPLYYSETDGEFAFASEIKGLLAAAKSTPTLDGQALTDYLTWGAVLPPLTIYREVRAVDPGGMLVVRDRRIIRKERYWRVRMLPKIKLTRSEAVEEVDRLIREAVRLRLRSDVPVGAFLSGGIDSAIVTAMAAEQYPGTLTTVTIGFEEGPFDERPLARLVAERYATDHHEVVVRPDVANDLPIIAAAYDQPFADSSAIPTYYVARAARQFTKVVLNGDGGDEVFAGYRKFQAARIANLLRFSDGPRVRPAWRFLARVLPVPRTFRTPYAFVHRLIRGMALDPVTRYLSWTINLLSDEEKVQLLSGIDGRPACQGQGLSPDWVDRTLPSSRLVRNHLAELDGTGRVDQMLGLDLLTSLPHDLLVKMDIACMAHSLEARSPILDHVMIDAVSRFPEHIKLFGCRTKPLLRLLSRRYVPPDIQTAPKRGFEIPVLRWLQGELRELSEDIVLSRNGILADLFHRGGLERLLREETGIDPGQWARRVWAILMLGVWDTHVRPRAASPVR